MGTRWEYGCDKDAALRSLELDTGGSSFRFDLSIAPLRSAPN